MLPRVIGPVSNSLDDSLLVSLLDVPIKTHIDLLSDLYLSLHIHPIVGLLRILSNDMNLDMGTLVVPNQHLIVVFCM